MNHTAVWKGDAAGNLTSVKCNCGWSQEGDYWVLRRAFDAHADAHIPQWRDRPNVPGLWLCRMNKRFGRRRVARHLSQRELNEGQPFDTARVYGPIPDDPEETP